ncbi:MAG: hypothetical protein GY711_16750 [bacterium]|nr:hypothetical protein [bacterium]
MARRRRRSSGWDDAGGWGGYRPYVPVARRRKQAELEAVRAKREGRPLDPVRIEGREIVTTTWGRAWYEHIESFHDFSNRLPRGRTYVRNGSVYHLAIGAGEISARVMGSSPYEQNITIAPCKPTVWKRVRRRCAGGIGSLIELLEGRISSEVMAAMTGERDGLLPDLKHVQLGCSCPDWALLCKHLAAVLYGVGARLDDRPELLFTLRGVDPAELVDTTTLPGQAPKSRRKKPAIEGSLSSVFGIELDEKVEAPAPRRPKPKASRGGVKKKTTTRRPRKVSRQELLEAGVPPGTIATWLRQGVLVASDERGVYRHTRESRARVGRYGG